VSALHIPVMLTEVIEALAPTANDVIVDGTFGVGGYSQALLDAAPCRVIAIDRDPQAVARGLALQSRHPDRFRMLEGRFGAMDRLLAEQGLADIDGVTLDLGVSSPQIDDPARGFSFQTEGPLDMRMGQAGESAADLVNARSEGELADLIYHYGEERMARRIAQAIIAARPLATTLDLAECVRAVVRRAADGIDPATRTFQALRIAVNDELGELDRGLVAAEKLLKPGGRLAVVSFHSLEDRRVKAFLKARAGLAGGASRHRPAATRRLPSFTDLVRRLPSAAECARNPRARSARLRAARRTDAPAWGGEERP